MRRSSTQEKCHVSPHERRLRTFLAAIFATHGLLQAGSIVDCGAEKGGEACWLADLAPSRRVHAIEPLASNLQVRASRAPYTCSRTTRAHDGPFFSFSCPRNLWCVHAACSTSAGIAGATSCRCSAVSAAPSAQSTWPTPRTRASTRCCSIWTPPKRARAQAATRPSACFASTASLQARAAALGTRASASPLDTLMCVCAIAIQGGVRQGGARQSLCAPRYLYRWHAVLTASTCT